MAVQRACLTLGSMMYERVPKMIPATPTTVRVTTTVVRSTRRPTAKLDMKTNPWLYICRLVILPRRWSGTNVCINVLDEVRKVDWAADINAINTRAGISQWELANSATEIALTRTAQRQINPRLLPNPTEAMISARHQPAEPGCRQHIAAHVSAPVQDLNGEDRQYKPDRME